MKKVLIGVAVAVVAALAIGGWIAGQDDADQAEKGDCVVNEGSTVKPDVKIVECGSDKAEFKVAEKHDGKAECNRTKYAQYWETKGDDVQFTLCLEQL